MQLTKATLKPDLGRKKHSHSGRYTGIMRALVFTNHTALAKV